MSTPTTLHLRTQSLLSTQLTYLTHLRRSHIPTSHRLASTTSTTPNPNPPIRRLTPENPLPLPTKDHIPSPLSRPLGLPYPPQPNTNTGLDTRTWRQRRDDFFDYDKHLARRRTLTSKISKPYFRDWSSLSLDHKGKTFLAPRTLIRAEKALYFPNLRGYTLRDVWKADKDTTEVLRGRVSLVGVYSGQWAQRQVGTFIGGEGKGEGEMWRLLGECGGLQGVDVNIEEQGLRAGLMWMFIGNVKKMVGEEDWGRYFVVRKGLGDEVRSGIGIVNGSVGYVYLVDWDGKIRWAANGEAAEGEREGLMNGARRLLEQWKTQKAAGTRSKEGVVSTDPPKLDAAVA